MLNLQVVMLRVRCSQPLLRNRQYRKRRGAEHVGPECCRKRKWSEIVGQEWRIQHYISWNVPDDRFVEHSVSGANYCLAIAACVPRHCTPRSHAVVVGSVNAADLALRDCPATAQDSSLTLYSTRERKAGGACGRQVL